MAALGREHRQLSTVVSLAEKIRKTEHELAQARELVLADDPEMAEAAQLLKVGKSMEPWRVV